MNKCSLISNNELNRKQDRYPPFLFNGKRIPMKVLDICEDLREDKKQLKKLQLKSYINYRSKSTPHFFQELQTTNNENQKQFGTKISIFIPLRNAVEKIQSQSKKNLPRRKSCYGQLFGNIVQKQIDYLPTVIEMHKKLNGKEFALSSFAQLLKKSQRNSPQCIAQSNRILKDECIVEYDTMERPPTCRTVKIYKAVKLNQKCSQSSSIKFSSQDWQQQKFSLMMNDSKSRKNKLSSIPFKNSIKSRQQTIKLQTCLSELLSSKGPVASTYRSMHQETPYQKQNEFLQKQIKSELKCRSIYNAKATISVFCY